jgi:hypothetical protein
MKLQSWEDLLVNVPLDASFIASDPVLERRVLENTHPGPRVWDPSIQESGGWHAWPADPVWHCTRFAEGATWTGFDGLAVEGDMKGAAARFRLPHADLLLANGQMDEGACLETDRGVVTTTARWTTRAPSLPAEGERILVRLGGDTLSLSGHTAEVPDVLLESIDDEALSALVSWAASGDAEGRRQAWSDDDYDGLPHVVETAMGRNPLYAETNSDQ